LRDEHDLAQRATITATSETRFNDQEPGMVMPLLARAGAVLWDWAPTLESVELYLRNRSSEAQPLNLIVYRARREPKWVTVDEYQRFRRNDLRDRAFAVLSAVSTVLPAGHEGWFRIDFPEPLEIGAKDAAADDDRLLIALDENRDVAWALAKRKNELFEMVEHSHHIPEWRDTRATATLRLTPPPALGEANNATNGFHRRFSRGPTNMWISRSGQGMPQDLILTWAEPQAFDEVCLVFDNLTALRHDNPWESGIRVLPFLVRSYSLAYWCDGAWHELIHVACNIHRFRRHRFETVKSGKLRLRVHATHGQGWPARVYQLSVAASGSGAYNKR
jgi:hypothetical protein